MCRGTMKRKEIVELWVSRDAPDAKIKEEVERLKKEGRMIVVFRSGDKNLVEQTAELLRHNL